MNTNAMTFGSGPDVNPRRGPNTWKNLFALLTFTLLTACGGGGSSGGTNGGGNGQTVPPKDISGIAMLGPVAEASVEIHGTGGRLATGTTSADGSFGPIEFAGSYDGPLRIVVTGTADSTWICDLFAGCIANNVLQPVGTEMVFDGDMEAVLPTASSSQTVTVSLLSHMASSRVDVLGGLSAGNVNQANGEIAELIRSILFDAFNSLAIDVDENFATIPLFDMQNLPAPGGSNDQLAAILTVLNSSLVALAQPAETTGSFLARLGSDVAAQPDLPISDPDPSRPSLESFTVLPLFQMASASAEFTAAMDQLLAPEDTSSLLGWLFTAYHQLPFLTANGFVSMYVDDAAISGPIVQEVEIGSSTGAAVMPADVGLDIFERSGGDWLSASIADAGGLASARLEARSEVLETLPNGFYESTVILIDQTGMYRRGNFRAELTLALVGRQVYAGDDVAGMERSSVLLSGSTSSPGEVAAVNWVQTSGPAVTITDADTFAPSIDLPAVDAESIIELQLDVDFTGGQRRSDFITITILAYPNIEDLSFSDASLDQCITDTANTDNLVEAIELTTLTCSGVSSVAGIDVFENLVSLDLAGNSLDTLQPLLGIAGLQFLDISGNPTLPCGEIDQLAESLEEGVSLIVDDTCRGGFALDLAGSGFDIALDEPRNQLYVSIPDRNEIAAISLADFRIVDRLQMPGRANGIDLSIDGTRLFVALNGNNAVAIVDVDQRSVTTIDLGVAVDHASTWDVVEGEPDRIFVSANPGSGGLAKVAQVRLDQGNIASSVASNNFIRSRPALARSPDQMFVYVGSGFSPNSLYKLSLADPDAPIVLEDDHGSVSGTENLALNPSGTRIALSSGQVLRTGSFIEEGRVTGGTSIGSRITDTLFVAGPNGVVEAFDFTTLAATGVVDTQCDSSWTNRMVAFDNDESFALLQGTTVCIYAQVSRSTPPDPYPNLRLPDLALEECVIDTAISQGISEPEEFTALDCSLTPKTILGISGIESFVNLTSVDLSNSNITDISLLGLLDQLDTVVLRNSRLSDISPLLTSASLSNVDFTGNPGIPCTDLDQLVASAVSVVADECAETVRIELGGIGHELIHDEATNRAFVSIPSLNQVAELDLATGTVTQGFALSAQPRGIDLSNDGTTLYAALYDVGDVAILDSTTGISVDVDISVELDDDRTWDVAEVSTGRIVVSTNPGSNGFGYVVEVRTDESNAATRVASNTIIRASPIFAVSPDESAVYVGAGFSPNSLYKLDATQADLPIIAEDDHGEVSGTSGLALTPDGSRIHLLSGQVLSTDTLQPVAQFPAGRSTVTADGSSLLVGDTQTDGARVYDIATTAIIGVRQWGCDLLSLSTIVEYGDGILVLGDDLVCYSRTVPFQ